MASCQVGCAPPFEWLTELRTAGLRFTTDERTTFLALSRIEIISPVIFLDDASLPSCCYNWDQGEMTITHEANGDTVLAGLHGVLACVRDLGLTLVSVNRMEPTVSMNPQEEA